MAHVELKAAQDELDGLKESSSKYREDIVMEIFQLTTQAEDTERWLAEVPKRIDATKTTTLAEYQSLAELGQFQSEGFEDGVRTFIYNVWREHLE